MKKILCLSLLTVVVAMACKSGKPKTNKENFFPVLSFIKSQVADIDTSLYMIRKINIYDSVRTDTEYIKREDVRALAADFLNMPDLTQSKYKEDYDETKMYDESLNRVIYSCKPAEPEKQDIQLQEVVVIPNLGTGDKVHSIIVNRATVNKDSTVEKRMLWQVDQSFQITTTVQKPGQPEVSRTYKVSWNEQDQ